MVLSWGTAAPDGFKRPVILVNGKFPAPTLEADLGDRIVIEVVNNLTEPTSIHW